MNVEIQASKNLDCKSPFCLPPGPRSLEISSYQASENPPPACPPSHKSSFSPWGQLNGGKHKVRRTRKYFSLLLLHPPVDLNHRGKDLFLPDLAKGLFAVSLTPTGFSQTCFKTLYFSLSEIPILSADPVRIPERTYVCE
ncbi:hypothetical protein AMECASPLE_002594 [Ameca splendens]|uniref:Uncharacterized protein n=1 Tax=Ameca splendens TaxID=208324 RepID=A0ABV0Y9E7_9TELE